MSYAGDVSSTDAFAVLQSDPDAVLVDVRSGAEWDFVGVPVLDALGKRVVAVEWSGYPGGVRNERFVEQVAAAGVHPGQTVFFLCRSGARSRSAAAAATAAGLGPAFNVADGFEGPLGPDGHRDVAGWKAAGLPWRQG